MDCRCGHPVKGRHFGGEKSPLWAVRWIVSPILANRSSIHKESKAMMTVARRRGRSPSSLQERGRAASRNLRLSRVHALLPNDEEREVRTGAQAGGHRPDPTAYRCRAASRMHHNPYEVANG